MPRHLTVFPQGMVLLLALLILASILTTSLTVGALVIRQLKFTSTTDRGIVAYYAAESGLEQGLYLWRQEGRKGDELNIAAAAAVTLANSRGAWWRESQEVQSSLLTSLKQNDSLQLDLFDPVASISGTAVVKSIKVGWEVGSGTCPGEGQEWLEASWSAWGEELTSFDTKRNYINHNQIASSPDNTVIFNITNPSQPSYVNYRLRLKPLYGDICNFRLTAYRDLNGTGGVYDLPARITITAIGQMTDTRQSLSVTVPQFAPQAGVFDYSVFSECSILKGDLTEACP